MKKLFAVLAALVLMGVGLANHVAHAQSPLTMILIGGNDDPTSSDFATRLQNNGWIPKGANVIKIAYPADVSQGDYSTLKGSEAIIAAYNTNCQGDKTCELHGASMGTNPLIRASRTLGVPCADLADPRCLHPKTKVVLHGSP